MREKISVIVPVYNAGPYLERCLDSVLRQSHESLEVILIDDGSADQSGALCEAYAKRDSRVRVIHQTNQGPSSARNRGMEIAGGEWITFVDSDDYIEPDLCGYLLRLARQANADLAQCGAVIESAARRRTPPPKADRVLLRGVRDFDPETWRRFGNEIWGKLYRRKMVCRARFDPACQIGEDLHFNFQALRCATRVVLGAEPKYHYVLTADSLFRAKPSRGLLLSCREMLERAAWEFRDNPAILRRVTEERYRNGLDICSKIVVFRMGERETRRIVQREIRDDIRRLVAGNAFLPREKLKFILIAYLWPIYCGLLLCAKRRERRRNIRCGRLSG